MTGKVPGIQDITFGPTFTTDRANGYTHALVVDLDDKAALEVLKISLHAAIAMIPRRLPRCHAIPSPCARDYSLPLKILFVAIPKKQQTYGPHPEHQAVVAADLKPNFEGPPLAMDYEF